MKHQFKQLILQAIAKLYPDHVDIDFSVDYPPAGIDADFSSNAAMVLAKKIGKKPMDTATSLSDVIASDRRERGNLNAEEIASSPRTRRCGTPRNDGFAVAVAPPGFLNFKLGASVWHNELKKILKAGEKYGQSKVNKGKKARVEYVSANPTGPIHVGNARGGPYGETICRLLEATGYKVLREYLHNDMGGQVKRLGKTIWYWYQKLQGKDSEFPEDGYQGEYPKELGSKILEKFGSKKTEKDIDQMIKYVLDLICKENMDTLKRLGIEYDLVVAESELVASKKTKAAIEELKSKGLTKESEGALWFAPDDEFLADREAVIVKSDGDFTYFASDIAYHREKFTSGYDLVIDIFGSNHHGHVPKLQALARIFGFEPEKFKVLLYQYVRIKRGKEVVKMAKRAGNYITAKEVLDEVGKDSMIFTLLQTATNTHVDFDLELAKDTSEKNPVYMVQYAHARVCSIFKKAAHNSALAPPCLKREEGELLVDPLELSLIRELAKFPELVEESAANYAVHHLPHYLLRLADKFHHFYEKIRVIGDDAQLTAARLALVKALQQVLANGLTLMGIKQLERM